MSRPPALHRASRGRLSGSSVESGRAASQFSWWSRTWKLRAPSAIAAPYLQPARSRGRARCTKPSKETRRRARTSARILAPNEPSWRLSMFFRDDLKATADKARAKVFCECREDVDVIVTTDPMHVGYLCGYRSIL